MQAGQNISGGIYITTVLGSSGDTASSSTINTVTATVTMRMMAMMVNTALVYARARANRQKIGQDIRGLQQE